jgi:Protein of unknown function (DUF3501)
MTASSIRPVTLDDVIGIDRYEAVRNELRSRIIALKRRRRLTVGPFVTFVFENHDTVHFQIQEMIRAERITDLDAIRFELEVYNALLPRVGELSATMLIEITAEEDIPKRLNSLLGIDEAVRFEIGDDWVVPAVFEAGQSNEEKLSAVQYVRFPLPAAARVAFADPNVPVVLVVDHRNYRARANVEADMRAALAEDLRDPG